MNRPAIISPRKVPRHAEHSWFVIAPASRATSAQRSATLAYIHTANRSSAPGARRTLAIAPCDRHVQGEHFTRSRIASVDR